MLGKNNALSSKIFTCFKMHPVNKGGAVVPIFALLNLPLISMTSLLGNLGSVRSPNGSGAEPRPKINLDAFLASQKTLGQVLVER